MGCSKSSSKREVYRDRGLPLRNKKNVKQPNLLSKGIRKRRTNKAQSKHKEGNNDNQRGNKLETKKNRKDKARSCFFKKINKINKLLAKVIKKKREDTDKQNEK